MKKLLLSMMMTCFAVGLFAQVTWVGASTGGDWQVGTNWSSGAAPAATDAVLLNTGPTDSLILTNLPAAISVTQLTITNTKVRIVNGGAATTFNITGATGVDLSVGVGSALVFGGTAATAANGVIAMNLASGATAEISGYVQLTSNTGVSYAHRLQVLGGSNAIAFKANSTFVSGPGFTGNPFGAGASPSSPFSVLFENASTCQQNGGSTPLGGTGVNTTTTFQDNSTYIYNVGGALSMSSSGRTFGNVTFSNATFTATSGGTSTCVINGNLLVAAGNPILAGAGGFTVKGNITVNTGASLTFGSATACPVNLTGTTEQTITANGAINFISTAAATQLILNNPAGAKLGNNLTINKMTLTAGKFKLGNYNLTTTVTGTPISGATPTKFIVTDGTGKLRISGNNVMCEFPVGASATDGDINQVRITGATGTETFEVRVAPANAGFISDYGINRTWDISRAGSINATEIKFGFNDAQAGTLCNPANAMDLGHFDAVNGWEATQTNIVPTAGGSTVNDKELITTAPVTSFSPFSVGTTGQVALGVELTKFEAKSVENQVKLTWQTASERDNAFFAVEYSRDGRNFETIGEVKGNGTTSSVSNYNFTHPTAAQGVNYYRVRQVDLNGKSATTAVRSALIGKNGVRVYPTAANQTLTIEAANETEQTFEILNLQGQKVMSGEFASRKTLDISELTTGNYFVKIGQTTVRFTKN
jgi:hypothetical protein